jgi:hypothetical protein
MPVASFKPEAPSPVNVEIPQIHPEAYKPIVVDNRQVEVTSLLAYIEGSPWTVSYFSQVLGTHTDVREFDPTQSAVYQQYTRINELELRVTTPLSSTQDEESGQVTVTGTALVYPFLVPNLGDVFITATLNAPLSLFRISRVQAKTFNRQTVYEVDYNLIAYLTAEDGRYLNLLSKVIREYHFYKERLIEGLPPTVVEEDYHKLLNLKQQYRALVRYYFQTFFNPDYATLTIPGQNFVAYDSFLVNYLLKLVEVEEAEELQLVTALSTEKDPYLAQPQFWMAMLQRDLSLLGYCQRTMGLVGIGAFSGIPAITSLRYTGIQYLVYPVAPDQSLRLQGYSVDPRAVSEESLANTASAEADLTALFPDPVQDPSLPPPIWPTLKDGTYVLSQSFYTGTGLLSILESLTRDYLNGAALSLTHLTTLLQSYRRWPRLEQFYYLPILITLIKTAQRGLHA